MARFRLAAKSGISKVPICPSWLKSTCDIWVRREQRALAHRVLERSVNRTVGGHHFFVPAPEERVISPTLSACIATFFIF